MARTGDCFEASLGTLPGGEKTLMIVITVARKSCVATGALNVVQWGCGALNIEGCRIEGKPQVPGSGAGEHGSSLFFGTDGSNRAGRGATAYIESPPPSGRWPANLILQCSNDHILCPIQEMDLQSGLTQSQIRVVEESSHLDPSRENWRFKRYQGGHTDAGGASRFFKQIGENK